MKQFYTFIFEANVNKIYDEFKDNIDRETYNLLIEVDPSSNHKDLRWIVKNYLKLPSNRKATFFNDEAPRIKSNLNLYRRNEHKPEVKIKDINKFNFDEFNIHVENTCSPTKSDLKDRIKQGKDEIELFEETEKYIVIIPKTVYAACYWGKNTNWCTATENLENNMFESYNKKGPIYTIVDKENPDKKYQAGFVENQFTDNENKIIDVNTLKLLLDELPNFKELFRNEIEQYVEDIYKKSKKRTKIITNFDIDYYSIHSNDIDLFEDFYTTQRFYYDDVLSVLKNEYDDVDILEKIEIPMEAKLVYICDSENINKITDLIGENYDEDDYEEDEDEIFDYDYLRLRDDIFENLHQIYMDNIVILENIRKSILDDINEAGYSFDFDTQEWSVDVSIEHLYKLMTGEIDYRDHTDILSSDEIEKGYINRINIDADIFDSDRAISLNEKRFNEDVKGYLSTIDIDDYKY